MKIQTISFFSDQKIIYNHNINKSPKPEDFSIHTHEIFEIIFLINGDVSGIINGKTYLLKKYDLIIFRPCVIHGIMPNSDKTYERINILFDGKTLANGIFGKIPPGLDVIDCSENNIIKDIFKKLDYYPSRFDSDNLKKIIHCLINELLFNISLVGSENKFSETPSYIDPIIEKAIKYMDENYLSPITVDDVCKKLFISKSHLHHLFINTLNISPKKYINAKRVTKAQSMIRNGIKPNEAYLECGFFDYATFYRNYKLHFGHLPSEERDSVTVHTIKS